MSFPITVDAAAIPHLKRLIVKDGRDGVFLRVGVKGGGCSGFEYVMMLDVKARDNDHVTVIDGIPIRCDAKSAAFLMGARLVFTGNLIGGGFQFENPNAARSCGCGTSFTPKAPVADS